MDLPKDCWAVHCCLGGRSRHRSADYRFLLTAVLLLKAVLLVLAPAGPALGTALLHSHLEGSQGEAVSTKNR